MAPHFDKTTEVALPFGERQHTPSYSFLSYSSLTYITVHL